jgi:hypothetical protein
VRNNLIPRLIVDLTSFLAQQCLLTLRRSLLCSKDIHLIHPIIRKQFTKIYYHLSKYRRIRNSLSPPRQYQQQGSSETNLRPGGRYSQSYVSQDYLSTGRSSAPIEMDSSLRPVVQSSARPPSDFSMSINYQSFNKPPSPVYQYVDRTANVPGNIYYDQSPENRWTTH